MLAQTLRKNSWCLRRRASLRKLRQKGDRFRDTPWPPLEWTWNEKDSRSGMGFADLRARAENVTGRAWKARPLRRSGATAQLRTVKGSTPEPPVGGIELGRATAFPRSASLPLEGRRRSEVRCQSEVRRQSGARRRFRTSPQLVEHVRFGGRFPEETVRFEAPEAPVRSASARSAALA